MNTSAISRSDNRHFDNEAPMTAIGPLWASSCYVSLTGGAG